MAVRHAAASRLWLCSILSTLLTAPATAHDNGELAEARFDTAQAEPPSFSGFLYASIAARQLEHGLNDANGAKVPTTTAATAAIIELRRDFFWARARFAEERLRTPRASTSATPWTGKGQAEITQLSLKLPLSEQAVLTAGRLNMTFDDGQSFHPLDFLEDAVRSTDFEDRAGRYRGFPLLMVSRADAGSAYRLIYSDDSIYKNNYVYAYGGPNPGFNRGLRQWLASARWSIDQLTSTLVFQRPSSGNAGIGLSASYVANASMSMHAAIFATRGNPLPLHRNVFLRRGTNLNASDVYRNESPVKAWRADERKVYSRWLIGSTYTGESGATYVLELWRDDRGMSDSEQDTWASVARFHHGLDNAAARAINLAYDLESLRSAAHGTQAFFRVALPMPGDAILQPSALLSTRDGSGTTNLRWSQRINNKWDFELEAWLRIGGAYTQYGSAPDKSGIAASARFFF